MSQDLTPVSSAPTPAEPEVLEAERIPRTVLQERSSAPRAAWVIAIAADLLQLALFPIFAGGAVSPWSDALDFLVAFLLIRRLGWHWAFLPTIVAELIPFVDLIPSWTFAVFLATRGRRGTTGS
jgi:hypothetical protein